MLDKEEKEPCKCDFYATFCRVHNRMTTAARGKPAPYVEPVENHFDHAKE